MQWLLEGLNLIPSLMSRFSLSLNLLVFYSFQLVSYLFLFVSCYSKCSPMAQASMSNYNLPAQEAVLVDWSHLQYMSSLAGGRQTHQKTGIPQHEVVLAAQSPTNRNGSTLNGRTFGTKLGGFTLRMSQYTCLSERYLTRNQENGQKKMELTLM